jgi:SpoVK/Ycf46/Vps4 family AAA+-type ATPase
MKSNLMIKLIEAHCSGSEAAFKKALQDMAIDEERKGNLALSAALRNAYAQVKQPAFPPSSPLSEMSFVAQNAVQAPRDKDSALELLEVFESAVPLSDVALPAKTREALVQIIEEQREVKKLTSQGVAPANRVLLCGPPGCGKTLTANALAKEINIPIAYVKLDGLVSSYLGQTGTNIRKIFEYVKNKRILLFLDEFDAIAKKRDDAHELGELKRVVTTLLQNMDAMGGNVFLVAATNHHHLLDPAIWRRFNASVFLDLPDVTQREEIITKFWKEILNKYEFDMKTLVALTEGTSGAQINNFLQSVAKNCILYNKGNSIDKKDIVNAWLKQSTLFISENSETYTRALKNLNKNGIPMRMLEEITGIPKSTLSYRFTGETAGA